MKHSIVVLIFGLIAFANGFPLRPEEERTFQPIREGILIKKIDNAHKYVEKSDEFDGLNRDDKYVYEKTEGGDEEIFEDDTLLKRKPFDDLVEAEKHFEDEVVREHFADQAAEDEIEEHVPQENSYDKKIEIFNDPVETEETEINNFEEQIHDINIKPVEFAEDEIREVEATYHEEPEQKIQFEDKFGNIYPRQSYEFPSRINSLFFFSPVADRELTSSRFLIPTFQLIQPDFKPFSTRPVNSFFVEKLKSLQESVKSLLSTFEKGPRKPEEEKEKEDNNQKKPEENKEAKIV